MRRVFAPLGLSRGRWALVVAMGLVVVSLSLLVRDRLALEWSVDGLREFVSAAGFWGPAVYVLLLGFRFAVLVPSSILLTAAGVCFGVVPGTLYAAAGLTLSGLLKFGAAAIAGRTEILRSLPERWRHRLAIGHHPATAGGLALVCAYPFGPKHVFQIAAVVSGMSFARYLLAVAAGAHVRAGAFALLGEAIATREGMWIAAGMLALVAAVPLAIPGFRNALLMNHSP